MENEDIYRLNTAVYKLRRPFKFGEEIVSEIKLTEPTAKKLSNVEIDIPTDGNITFRGKSSIDVIKIASAWQPSKLELMRPIDVINCYAECVSLFFGSTAEQDQSE